MSNLHLNKVILAGRLTADPELKTTPSGVAVCSFGLAVNRRGAQAAADFINVVVWRQSAEFVCKYFRKGSAICICGALQSRTWKDAQGKARYTLEVVADEVTFVDGKNEGGAGAETIASDSAVPAAIDTVSVPSFEDLKTDEDLPF